MEVNYIIEGTLKSQDEYCGALEIELFLASILIAAGLFGTEGVNKPLGVSFIPESIHMVHILLTAFILLILNFTLENLHSCFGMDNRRLIKYGSIPVLALCISLLHASFSPESY